MADLLARQMGNRLPPFQALAGEILPHRDRREGICLQMKAQNGDTRLMLTHFRNIPPDRRGARLV